MTGQLPTHTGGYDNAAYLPSTVPTVAHYLRAAGYRTVDLMAEGCTLLGCRAMGDQLLRQLEI
jgi:hypothetical protein